MLHIQIGPSPLALGLLVPLTRAAGFSVCIVARPGDNGSRQYGFAGTGPTGRLSYPIVDWYVGPNDLEDLPPDLLRRIESDEPLLLTCTLRNNVHDRRAFIEALIGRRPRQAETVVLACENAPNRLYGEIEMLCRDLGALYLRTVVNRMCIMHPLDSKGRRVVSAHELGEWLVERPKRPSEILDALEALEEFDVVDDIVARLARKLWMVNGAHQALALMAWEANRHSLEVQPGQSSELRRYADDLQASARNLRVSTRLSHLHAAMADALDARHPGLVDNLGYGLEHVVAYSEHPDSIKRVLGAFVRLNLAPFIEALDARLAEPARACAQEGRSVAAFAFVFDVFEALTANLDAFLDAAAVRAKPDLIDPLHDLEAAEAYVRLVDGWLPRKEANDRVLRLADNLAAHRL